MSESTVRTCAGTITGMRQALDPEGRTVELTPRAWAHIVERHPELESSLDGVMRAIETPSHRLRGRESNEVWYLLAESGPSRWLQVVVHFDRNRGVVTTAFGRRWIP